MMTASPQGRCSWQRPQSHTMPFFHLPRLDQQIYSKLTFKATSGSGSTPGPMRCCRPLARISLFIIRTRAKTCLLRWRRPVVLRHSWTATCLTLPIPPTGLSREVSRLGSVLATRPPDSSRNRHHQAVKQSSMSGDRPRMGSTRMSRQSWTPKVRSAAKAIRPGVLTMQQEWPMPGTAGVVESGAKRVRN